MAGRVPPAQSMGRTAQRLADTESKVEEVVKFDSSQYGRLYQKMLTLIAGIADQVTAAIALTSMTVAQIKAYVSAPETGITADGDLEATGGLTVGMDATVGGTLTATGGIVSAGDVSGQGIGTFLGSRNLVLSTAYAGMWMDGTGRLGLSPSSLRYKIDLEEWRPSDEEMHRLLMVRAVWYRLDPIVVAGADDRRMLGIIAEELEALGFPEFVFYDCGVEARDAIPAVDAVPAADAILDEETGAVITPARPAVPGSPAVPAVEAVAPRIQGINYDRITIALLRLAQWEHARHEQENAALRTELDQIRSFIGMNETEE